MKEEVRHEKVLLSNYEKRPEGRRFERGSDQEVCKTVVHIKITLTRNTVVKVRVLETDCEFRIFGDREVWWLGMEVS